MRRWTRSQFGGWVEWWVCFDGLLGWLGLLWVLGSIGLALGLELDFLTG